MLAKKNRLTKNGSFSFVYRKGKRLREPLMQMTFIPSKGGIRIGFSVPNKLGDAAVRNKLKRRLRAAMRSYLPQMQEGCQVVFSPTSLAVTATYQELSAAMGRLLKNAGLIL